jgi:hypothetical protein
MVFSLKKTIKTTRTKEKKLTTDDTDSADKENNSRAVFRAVRVVEPKVRRGFSSKSLWF